MDVLLVPGFMNDSALWDDMATDLAEIGPLHHVDTTLGASVQETAQIALADAPPRFLAVGFSMGGYIAREIARTADDRVVGLVLIASSARPKAAISIPAGGKFGGLNEPTIRKSLHPDNSDKETIAAVRAMSVRVGAEAFANQAQAREGDADRLGAITCPTLIIAGEQDQLRSLAEAQELQQNIAGATLQVLSQTGHMIPLEQPKALVEAISGWVRANSLDR